jgi:pivalyl-CoA mutase large subunit
LTDAMEREIETVITTIDDAGGMYKAVEAGLVQSKIGESALRFQERIESGEQKLVGVNCYQADSEAVAEPPPYRPDPATMQDHVEAFKRYKAARCQSDVDKALAKLRRAAASAHENVFAEVVNAAHAGVTHGEIIACLRDELGFGHPLIAA